MIGAIAVLVLASGLIQEYEFGAVSPSVGRVTCAINKGEGAAKVATCFVWPTKGHAVTCLHPLIGSSSIGVTFPGSKTIPAKVLRIHQSADLALLAFDATVSPPALTLQTETRTDGALIAVGYPLAIKAANETKVTLRRGGNKLRDILPPENILDLEDGYPSLDLDILYVQGPLLPGGSGSPLFDQAGFVVGVVDGGLLRGAADTAWGLPVSLLDILSKSKAGIPGADLSTSTLLWDVPIDSLERRPLPAQSSRALTDFARIGVRSLGQMWRNSDSRENLALVSTFLSAHTEQPVFDTRFDIYANNATGARIAFPVDIKPIAIADGWTVKRPESELTVHVFSASGPVEFVANLNQVFKRELGLIWTEDIAYTKAMDKDFKLLFQDAMFTGEMFDSLAPRFDGAFALFARATHDIQDPEDPFCGRVGWTHMNPHDALGCPHDRVCFVSIVVHRGTCIASFCKLAIAGRGSEMEATDEQYQTMAPFLLASSLTSFTF